MLRRRDSILIVLLCLVTFGLYCFYWIPCMAIDVNRIIKRDEFKFWQVFWVGIFTLGTGLIVFEIMYAFALQKNNYYQRQVWSYSNLGRMVLFINMLSLLIALFSGGISIIVSFILFMWASWFIQTIINNFAYELETEIFN